MTRDAPQTQPPRPRRPFHVAVPPDGDTTLESPSSTTPVATPALEWREPTTVPLPPSSAFPGGFDASLPLPPEAAARAAAAGEPTGLDVPPSLDPVPPPPPPRSSLGSTPAGGRPPWSPIQPSVPQGAQGLRSLQDVALAVQELLARSRHTEGGLERLDRWRARVEREMSEKAAHDQAFRAQMARDSFFANQQFAGMWQTVHGLGTSLESHRTGSTQALQDTATAIKDSAREAINEATRKQTVEFREELDKRTGPWVFAKALIPVMALVVVQLVLALVRK